MFAVASPAVVASSVCLLRVLMLVGSLSINKLLATVASAAVAFPDVVTSANVLLLLIAVLSFVHQSTSLLLFAGAGHVFSAAAAAAVSSSC